MQDMLFFWLFAAIGFFVLWGSCLAVSYLTRGGRAAPEEIVLKEFDLNSRPPSLAPEILKHVRQIARAKCAFNPQLAYAFGHALSRLKPSTIAETDLIFSQHAESLNGRPSESGNGWSHSVIIDLLAKLGDDERQLFYVQCGPEHWEVLDYSTSKSLKDGKWGMNYSLAQLLYQGTHLSRPYGPYRDILTVRAVGVATQVNSLMFIAAGEAKMYDRWCSLVEDAIRIVLPNLLGIAIPHALANAMREQRSISLAIGDVQIEYGYKFDRPYWAEPDQATVSLKLYKFLPA